MSSFQGNINGVNIIPYSSRGGKQYSPEKIGKYLKKFKLCDALNLIGQYSYRIFKNNSQFIKIKGVCISYESLAYLSMRLIEESNDSPSSRMTEDDLLEAIDMFYGLPYPWEKDDENLLGLFTRMGASQLDHNREMRHLFPRTLIMYEDFKDLWNKHEVDIEAAIQSFSSLNLREILALGLFFSTGGCGVSQGFFRLRKNIDIYPDALKQYLDWNKQQTFANWISCTYKEFRSQLEKDVPPSVDYERFRFNPLLLKPAIIPDCNPQPGCSQVYITPIPTLIYRKVTRGLYFSLADHFRNQKSNPFRTAFGYVFQEYVGLLLKKTMGDANVKSEWRQGPKKCPIDTPDWFVIKNGVAVVIEVKQSGLYLEAKKWGKIDKIQKDIPKTIGKGVEQLWKFEQYVNDNSSQVPDWFNDIKIVERLVVTYDLTYFSNSILRGAVRNLYPSIPKNYHWHTIAVEQLEYFLGMAGTNFIEALTEKRLNTDWNSMDFREYWSKRYSSEDCNNPFLNSVYDHYFSELGIL